MEESDFCGELGKNLRAARKSAGLTQRQLAELIGCTPTTLGYWERGTYGPPVGKVFRICTALGTAVREVIPK